MAAGQRVSILIEWYDPATSVEQQEVMLDRVMDQIEPLLPSHAWTQLYIEPNPPDDEVAKMVNRPEARAEGCTMTNPVMVIRTWTREVDGVTTNRGRGCWVWCPACEANHVFDIVGEDGSRPERACWDWDGNMERPTFSPSMLAIGAVHLCPPSYAHYAVCPNPDSCGQTAHCLLDPETLTPAKADVDGETVRGHVKPHAVTPAWGNCHSFLRAGRWEFLGDSAHALAGKTVDMVPLPDWVARK